MRGFSKPYKVERNKKGVDILLYIREEIKSKSVPVSFNSKNIEHVLVEINLRKKKTLLVCCYKCHKKFSKVFLTAISKEIDSLFPGYENCLIIGGLNCKIHEESMSNFGQIYGFKNLINDPTCYKNCENPTCIDLIMTSKPKCFQNFVTIKAELSEFHKMKLQF